MRIFRASKVDSTEWNNRYEANESFIVINDVSLISVSSYLHVEDLYGKLIPNDLSYKYYSTKIFVITSEKRSYLWKGSDGLVL